ncbi:hypothetical protein NSU18_03250 [Paenibacillus sp. FSL H8-0048]|uniref:hypothetical protein n=1 Tax=Paenibacillus sp. FSL H8-0048 TaxID=2954508 RepID=UPI0030F50416
MRYIFMDEITALTADSISGKKYVSLNEDIFRDHFPDQPVLPAALITESIIQLSRLFTWINSDYRCSLIPVSFERLKFLRMVSPPDILEVELTFENTGSEGDMKARARVMCRESELVCEGSVLFREVPLDALHREERCRSLTGILTRNLSSGVSRP